MAFIDTHCDVLSKLLQHPAADFYDKTVLTATLPRLKDGKALLQFFAIYMPESYAPGSFDLVLREVDRYYERILTCPEMMPVRRRGDLERLIAGKRIGALLSLEGVDAVPDDPMYFRILFQLGLRAVGLTWNHANWAADGAAEPRKGGLTRAGKKLVKECEKMGILLDVSHLSEKSFWDLADIAERPFFASHSNAFDVCPHPRNLSQKQIEYLISENGCIGLTFVPYFVSKGAVPSISDLFKHIDHICSLGGVNNLGFGSDFDGFDKPLVGLEHPGKYGTFREVLLKRYSEADIERFLHKNWYGFLSGMLPH